MEAPEPERPLDDDGVEGRPPERPELPEEPEELELLEDEEGELGAPEGIELEEEED